MLKNVLKLAKMKIGYKATADIKIPNPLNDFVEKLDNPGSKKILNYFVL